MVDVTPPTPPSPPAPSNKRARGAPAINELRPSPAIVSWIDRAVQRITSDPPWTYQADSPVASRVDAQRLPESDLEREGFAARAASQPQLAPPATSAPRSASLDTRSMPEDVRERFVRMGRYYYFPGGNVAFEDRGRKVVTKSENTEVVRSLVEIAKARGWQDITVSGTERFRREAWRQATFAGLIVRGYQPNEQDKRQFVRDLAKARSPQEPPEPLIDPLPPVSAPPYREMSAPAASTAQEEARTSPRQSQMTFERAADSDREPPTLPLNQRGIRAQRADLAPAVSMPTRQSEPKAMRGASKRQRVYAGRLLEHGEAPYKFGKESEPSYFVRLDTEEGLKDLWGVDFPRALNKAGVKEGDFIEVQLTGRKTASVKRTARDAQGHVLGEEEVPVHRNEWDVRPGAGDAYGASRSARSQSLHEPAASAGDSVRENPALTSALMLLRGAELLAEARIPDAARRAQFVDGVRAQLSQVLDSESMPPTPYLRERVAERARTSARVMS
jgi:hypothetical protein